VAAARSVQVPRRRSRQLSAPDAGTPVFLPQLPAAPLRPPAVFGRVRLGAVTAATLAAADAFTRPATGVRLVDRHPTAGHRRRRVPSHPRLPPIRCARRREPENTRPRLKSPIPPAGDRSRPRIRCHTRISGRRRLRPCRDAEFYVNGNPLNLDDPSGHRPACDTNEAGDCKAVYQAYAAGPGTESNQLAAGQAEAQAEQGYALTQLAGRVTVEANGAPPGVNFSSSTQVETLGASYQEYEYCVANTQATGANSAAAICASSGNDAFASIYQYLQQGGSSAALGRTEILGALFCKKLGNCGGPTLSDLAGLVALLPSLLPGGEATEPEAAPAIEAGVDEVLGIGATAGEAAAEATINRGAASFLDAGGGGNVLVYRSLNAAGDVNYVGITNDIARREAEQFLDKGIRIRPIAGLSDLSRADARAVEQVLIEEYGGAQSMGGTQLLNRINSIAPSNDIYASSIQRGCELLAGAGYPAPSVC
jgi:hypothetical protein